MVENRPAARKSEDTLWSSLAIPGLVWKLAGRSVLRCSEQAMESGEAVSSGSLSACCSLERLRLRQRAIALSGLLIPGASQRQYQSYEIIFSQQAKVTTAVLFCYNADGWRLGIHRIRHMDSCDAKPSRSDFQCEAVE